MTLAKDLNTAIDKMVKDDLTRDAIIKKMATAANIEEVTVKGILDGAIQWPPLQRLKAFSQVVDGVSYDDLKKSDDDEDCPYESDSKAVHDELESKELLKTIELKVAPEPAK